MIDFKMLQSFVDAVYNSLGLYKPLELRFRFQDNEETDAEYNPRFNKHGNIKRHVITLYVSREFEFERDFQTLLAHELIHAWQAENDIEDIHGELFQEWAGKLEKEYGPIMLKRIYDPELDTE